MPEPALDASRLDALVADRTRKRALARDAADRYQATRERRMDFQRRIAQLNMSGHAGGGIARATADDQIAALVAEYDRMGHELVAMQAEIDGLAAEAAAAASLVKSCIRFAIERGLPVSDELRRESDPNFVTQGA